MEYVSSCIGIQVFEAFCINAVKNGQARLVHNGKKDEDSNFFTKVYHINLKASIYPAEVRFWYDKRQKDTVRKDVAGVKASFEDLALILQAIVSKEINIDLPELNIARTPDGIRITQK